jgi:hypothetical protein
VRDPAAELPVLLRVPQEVDDLRQLRLRLVDSGDVREGDAVALGVVALLVDSGVDAWWLLPVAVALLLGVSVWRETRPG